MTIDDKCKNLNEIIEDCPLMEITDSNLNYDKVICHSKYECEYSINGVLPNHKGETTYCWKHMILPVYKKGNE